MCVYVETRIGALSVLTIVDDREEKRSGGFGLKNLSNMLTACQGPPTTVMNFSPFVVCGPAALISPGTNTVNMLCVCVCVCVCLCVCVCVCVCGLTWCLHASQQK